MSGAAAAPFTTETPVASDADFPFVRLRGPLALVGISTAAPTPALSAAGRVGADQLARLATQLDELGRRKLFRVVLIHHPPLPGAAKPSKQLTDAAAFRAVIARCGAELVLFGHTHVSALGRLKTPSGSAPAIGVPSASARPHHGKDHSRYHLYRIAPDGLWDELWESRDDSPYDLTFDRNGALIIGTGGKGKLYRLEGDPLRPTLLARAAASAHRSTASPMRAASTWRCRHSPCDRMLPAFLGLYASVAPARSPWEGGTGQPLSPPAAQ